MKSTSGISKIIDDVEKKKKDIASKNTEILTL